MKYNKKIAFTLVELIVVITILAILGTIAFINLQGYSTGARDSKRLSDINNIQKKIAVESSKGTSLSSLVNLVKTNSGLTINSASGTSIQGTANFVNLKENGDSFKDPITGGDYILSYSIGGSGTGAYKFTQISTVNEENNQAVVKGNYYQMQAGDSPSITLNPDDTYFVIDGGPDLPYELVAGGGTLTPPVITWIDLDPNCDIPDITIGTQTWAGCNSTLGTGIEYSVDQNCYDYLGNITTGCNRVSNEKENVYNTTYGVNNIWGKLYSWTGSLGTYSDLNSNGIIEANEQGDNGACGVGYHVPTDTEWTTLTNYITVQNGGSSDIGWSAQSGKNETNNLVLALKIPLAGYIADDFPPIVYNGRGYYTGLWSSTSDSSFAYLRMIYSDDPGVYAPSNQKEIYYSIRCIKD